MHTEFSNVLNFLVLVLVDPWFLSCPNVMVHYVSTSTALRVLREMVSHYFWVCL